MALLEVRDLQIRFKTRRGVVTATDGVSFEVQEGRTLALVGESGCGKSTLGRAILQLNAPTAGEVVYFGLCVSAPSPMICPTVIRGLSEE